MANDATLPFLILIKIKPGLKFDLAIPNTFYYAISIQILN